MIEQGGYNLSVGQKQLVCIARALLRKSKIVVMDEATANIDMNTEQIIQKALNLVLENSTVITVAHRIKTIINYDKILVLDAGEVKEFDSPTNLLKDENSLFHELFTKSTLWINLNILILFHIYKNIIVKIGIIISYSIFEINKN